MHQTLNRRRRRTREEIALVVAEYGTSGLSRAAFCRTHQLSSATLTRYLVRAEPATPHGLTSGSFVAVELADTTSTRDSGVALVLAGGRRLTLQRGFCPDTLQQVLSVLERR